MNDSIASTLLALLTGLRLGDDAPGAPNRMAFDDVRCTPGPAGATTLHIGRLEATALRFEWDGFTLQIARLALHDVQAVVRADGQRLRLDALSAREASLGGLSFAGPLALPAPMQQLRDAIHPPGVPPTAPPPEAWRLDPLAGAEGSVRGRITDAHLLFDADVTVPIRHGEIDFNQATVAHVGPDSRMGVSRLGLYVDAPNGRSYLYQFASAPIAGVEFEHRGSLLGPWISERGKLRLQPFAESMLRQGLGTRVHQGLTEQARALLGRTALAGELQLGDGPFGLPGLAMSFEGRDQGRNAIVLHSESLGRGSDAEIAALSVRDVAVGRDDAGLHCDALTARAALRLVVAGERLRFSLELDEVRAVAPRLRLRPSGTA